MLLQHQWHLWWLCALLTGAPMLAYATPTKQPKTTPPNAVRPPTTRATTPKKATPKAAPKRPTPPRAPATKRPVAQRLSRKHPLYKGIQLCRKARWSKARRFFLKAKKTQLLQLKRKDRPLLYLYLGLSYIHLLQQKEGLRAIENALLLDECTKLPKKLDLSPQIRRQFREFSAPYQRLCRSRRLAALRKRLAPPPRRGQPTKARTPKQNARIKHSKGIRLAAWLVLGSGTVALGSGFVAGGLSFLAELRRNEQAYTPEGTIEYIRNHKLAEQRALVANVLFGTAGALLFTGFALQLSQLIRPPAPPQAPVPKRPPPRTKPASP